jgi:hypothetical protein
MAKVIHLSSPPWSVQRAVRRRPRFGYDGSLRFRAVTRPVAVHLAPCCFGRPAISLVPKLDAQVQAVCPEI